MRVSNPSSTADFKRNILSHFDVLNDPKVREAKPYHGQWLMQSSLLRLYLLEVETFRRFLGMPPQKKQSVTWKGFINHKLSPAEKERFASWDVHDDDIWLLVAQTVSENYRFSTSYNQSNSTFNAVLSCNDPTSPNDGYSLSGYAPTWYQAIRVLLFKHVVLFDYKWDVNAALPKADDWG